MNHNQGEEDLLEGKRELLPSGVDVPDEVAALLLRLQDGLGLFAADGAVVPTGKESNSCKLIASLVALLVQ